MAKAQYNGVHRRLRKALLPLAYGKPCPLCGRPMLEGQPLDLDHSVPVMLGGEGPRRIVHAYCNRRMGAQLGNRRRGMVRRAARTVSRRW